MSRELEALRLLVALQRKRDALQRIVDDLCDAIERRQDAFVAAYQRDGVMDEEDRSVFYVLDDEVVQIQCLEIYRPGALFAGLDQTAIRLTVHPLQNPIPATVKALPAPQKESTDGSV